MTQAGIGQRQGLHSPAYRFHISYQSVAHKPVTLKRAIFAVYLGFFHNSKVCDFWYSPTTQQLSKDQNSCDIGLVSATSEGGSEPMDSPFLLS